MLYHGTPIGGLKIIKANSKSHTTGKTVAYFSEDRCYALVCCRSRNENFVTMGPDKNGKQHYFERFPDQLRVLYSGKRGYLYILDNTDGLERGKGNSWESESDVIVHKCEVVEDVYSEILKEEQDGNLVIHRYAEIDSAEQKMHANRIKEYKETVSEEMRQFYIKHFSALWD